MRSFAISAFATLAFGVFCSAAPTPLIDATVDVDVLSLIDVDVLVDARSVPEDKCLGSVLDGVVSAVSPIVEEIENIKTPLTADVLIPLLTEIKVILAAAVKDVNGLLGLPIGDILKTVTGTVLDVKGLAALICAVLKLVLNLVDLVLGLVDSVVKGEIISLVNEIVDLLAQLLSCILKLVGGILFGLIKEVLALIPELVDIIRGLGVTSLIKCLGL